MEHCPDKILYYWKTRIPGGGGGTPYKGLYGEAPPERGKIHSLCVYVSGSYNLLLSFISCRTVKSGNNEEKTR